MYWSAILWTPLGQVALWKKIRKVAILTRQSLQIIQQVHLKKFTVNGMKVFVM